MLCFYCLLQIEVGLEEDTAVKSLAGVVDADTASSAATSDSAAAALQKEKFYTPAGEQLVKLREELAPRTFAAAASRLSREKRRRTDASELRKNEENAASLYSTVSDMHCTCSQVGDKRPISSVKYSPCEKWVLTSSWSGQSSVWHKDSMEKHKSYVGHTCRVVESDWHPQSGLPGGPSSAVANFASASSDGTAMLWSLDDGEKPLAKLEGHAARLAHVEWHPAGQHVATTSYDRTWRLWDASRGEQILCQEGHAVEVYSLSFQKADGGALVATGDLGGVARVWDLRSGKSIFVMQGHTKGVLSIDWSPNGYKLATAGDDHTVRMWDLRAKGCEYVLPAHNHLVSKVKFAPKSGEYIVTSSYDRTWKVWNTRDFASLAMYPAHEDKLMSFDIAADEKHFVTSSFDRTFKAWSHVSEF